MKKHSIYSVVLASFIFLIEGTHLALGMDIKKIGDILLSQDKAVIMAVSGFAKTGDDIFIVPDYKDGNVKLFDGQGSLLKIWGQRGPGPLEFLSPRTCEYMAPFLALYDFSKQRVDIYKKEGPTDFAKLSGFVCPYGFIDLRFMGDEILVAAYIAVSDNRRYGLYSRNLKNGRIQYILLNEEKYGFSSFRGYESKKKEVLPLGSAGYCAVVDDNIYFVWEGDLRIIKIDRATRRHEAFGQRTKNYTKPAVTRALDQAFESRTVQDIEAEYQKMSFVNGLFADKDFIGVIYQNYDHQTALWKMFLQLYSLDGKLLKEAALPEAETYVNFRCNNSFYDCADRTLYYLSITYDPATSLDRYKIIKYRIEP